MAVKLDHKSLHVGMRGWKKVWWGGFLGWSGRKSQETKENLKMLGVMFCIVIYIFHITSHM